MCSCIGDAQNAFERIEEVDGLAKTTTGHVNDIVGKGNEVNEMIKTISPMLKGTPNPVTLMKVPRMCKDASDLSRVMIDLTKSCCTNAAEISQKIKEIMSGRCSKILRIVSGAGDGKRNDDPEEANTEQDCNELRELKDAIMIGNPATIVKEGYDCVEGIGGKVEVIETLCSASIKFAEAITTITSALLAMDISKVMGKLKDMVRMLRLSDLLAQFATEMLKLIECVGEVFEAVKAKISTGLPNMDEWKDTAGVVADMVDDMGNNLKGIAPEGIGNMMNKLF